MLGLAGGVEEDADVGAQAEINKIQRKIKEKSLWNMSPPILP
jgi:hypothetical protein